jgi:signal transduction histidine kinase
MTTPAVNLDTRIAELTKDVDFSTVAAVLATHRDTILAAWVAVVAQQPFHQGRPDRAVADHIPPLFDALVGLLQRTAPRWVDPGAPLEDSAVWAAARAHARSRFRQGLQAAEILTEFRVLRQEIGRVLRHGLDDTARPAEVIGAELLINDALDAASVVSLEALMRRVEQTREDFLARTVHDVRQPLTALKGSLEGALRRLQHETSTPPSVLASLARAQAAADQMATTLNTLLEVARIELGQLPLQRTAQHLGILLDRVVARLDPESAHRLVVHRPPHDLLTGWWDGAALERVISNVLSNALKYSPAGTPIDISLLCDGERVCLCVRDRGMGVAPEDLTRIFERYTRAQTARTVAGEGLGLYIAQGIVQAHGGRIWAESAGVGRGTTIQLCLPREGQSTTSAET